MSETRDMGSIPGLGRSHSSLLAWRIPWTEEPGGLQCVKLQRVRLSRHARTGHCLSSRRTRQLLKKFVPENEVHNTTYFCSGFNQHLLGTQYWVSCWVLGKQIKKLPVLMQLPLQARVIPLKHTGILKEFLCSFCLHQNFSIFNF